MGRSICRGQPPRQSRVTRVDCDTTEREHIAPGSMRRGGRRLAGVAMAILLVACGPPINVRRVPPRTVTAELSRSALNSNKESLFTDNVLYRWNLQIGRASCRERAAR